MLKRDESELGPVKLVCRQLSLVAQTIGFGDRNARWNRIQAWVDIVAAALFVLPMAAFVPAGGLAMGIHRVVTDPDDSPNRPLALTMFFVFFALFYSGLCWFAFVWPRTRYLRLHENGISGKWRWKKFAVRFEDIQYLVVGVRSSVIVDCFLKAVSFIFPPTKSVIEVRKQAFANSVSLLLRDGRKVHFGYLFVWFEASEVIRLLEVLSSRVRVHSGYPGS